MKRVIFFDIDGTLILTDGAGKKALSSAMNEVFSLRESNTDIDYGGRTDLSICKEIFELNGIEFKRELFDDFINTYTNFLKSELQTSKGTLLPGVNTLLERLHNDDRYELEYHYRKYSHGSAS